MLDADSIEERKEMLNSIRQINSRILSFQNYSMRRVWGLLFAILSLLVIVESLSSLFVGYFVSSPSLLVIANGAIRLGVFLVAMFYWFRLFDNSLRLVQFRERVLSLKRSTNDRIERFYWRNSIIVIFLLYVASEITISRFTFSFKTELSSIISMSAFVLLDLIMLRGLKFAFEDIPKEGIAVFISFLVVTIPSNIFLFLNIYLVAAFYDIELSLLFVGVLTPLICAFSFIYHAPDYLEEVNG